MRGSHSAISPGLCADGHAGQGVKAFSGTSPSTLRPDASPQKAGTRLWTAARQSGFWAASNEAWFAAMKSRQRAALAAVTTPAPANSAVFGFWAAGEKLAFVKLEHLAAHWRLGRHGRKAPKGIHPLRMPAGRPRQGGAAGAASRGASIFSRFSISAGPGVSVTGAEDFAEHAAQPFGGISAGAQKQGNK